MEIESVWLHFYERARLAPSESMDYGCQIMEGVQQIFLSQPFVNICRFCLNDAIIEATESKYEAKRPLETVLRPKMPKKSEKLI